MFAISLRRVYKVCDKVIVRSLRGRLGPSGPPVGTNPGLNSRLKAFQKEGVKIEDDDVEEFVEQSESNMCASGDAYSEHLNETLIGKHILRHQVVKEKYFKEHMPNLLTWSEKEQIRLLNSENPEEWTPDRIAESFPVTAPVVKKLLKYPWKPASESRIARHDASALRNWRELKEGTLDIPEQVRQHFLKFSDRSIPPLDKKSLKVDLTPEQPIGEFQKIVDRCAAKDNSNGDRNEPFEEDLKHSKEQHSQSKFINKKRTTLDELTNKIKTRLEQGKSVNVPDQLIVKTMNSSVSSSNSPETNYPIELEDAEEKAVTNYKEEEKIVAVASYPERIRIPKKAYKKGATYKVNDCYYDDDGRFLYRVIGMTSNNTN
ncbi:hypothetical protein JYU34_015790 [Plutella xylostella]|uniref:Neugrin n=1 Tax=Plutella xylostella TaxID=51655 RepID=A0ABQ7Q4R7_PLUXY|nr:hypothetical protein JYU34_015790 [Plutella xylostella]